MKYTLSSSRRAPWLRWIVAWSVGFAAVVVTVPALLTHSGSPDIQVQTTSDGAAYDAWTVSVYLTKQKQVKRLPLEEYVQGVVAAEMPIQFSLEALKAQALTARTYVVRRMLEQDASNVPVSGAIVTDTVVHQAYMTDDQLRDAWGQAYDEHMRKLRQVVEATAGQILTYEGKPIEALFFSTSSGRTENSEHYWGTYLPYLRSVPSPWDAALSPRYTETVSLSSSDFQSRLGLGRTVSASAGSAYGLKLLEQSSTGGALKVSVAGKTMTGREFREKLGLNSTHFKWSRKEGQIQITTTGYGHGVGMSQYGAQGMALEGRTAEQIVKHYYTGIEISKLPLKSS